MTKYDCPYCTFSNKLHYYADRSRAIRLEAKCSLDNPDIDIGGAILCWLDDGEYAICQPNDDDFGTGLVYCTQCPRCGRDLTAEKHIEKWKPKPPDMLLKNFKVNHIYKFKLNDKKSHYLLCMEINIPITYTTPQDQANALFYDLITGQTDKLWQLSLSNYSSVTDVTDKVKEAIINNA